jgi:purine-binding chemotaxis protein CheW
MLVTRVAGVTCAIPIEHVVETMRPRPIEPLGRPEVAALAAIEGVSMIRGAPVPVIDVRRLLGVASEHAARFIVVRIGERRLALVVDEVVGVRRIEPELLSRLPPVLGGAHRDWVSAIGARDTELLVVLDAARVIPDDAWQAIEPRARGGER